MDERQALRERLGRFGAWTFAFDAMAADDVRAAAVEIESLGYSALWIPEGSHSRDVFAHLSLLLSATSTIAVCSGIANITARAPEVTEAGAVTLADAFGERFVLGVGVGHEYSTQARGIAWANPFERMVAYLDRMDAAASSLPPAAVGRRRLLAALGPRMLRLSAERALGAHTYFVPVEHTASARKILGPEPVLAVEMTAVLETRASTARAVARAWAGDYLGLPNYVKDWRRLGYSDDDVAGEGSDRLVDAGIAWGGVDAIARRVTAHLGAGADHVCVQFVSTDAADVCLPAYRELIAALPSG